MVHSLDRYLMRVLSRSFQRRLIQHNRLHKIKLGPIRQKVEGDVYSGGVHSRKILKLEFAKYGISCILGATFYRDELFVIYNAMHKF